MINEIKSRIIKVKNKIVIRRIIQKYKRQDWEDISKIRLADLYCLRNINKGLYCEIIDIIYKRNFDMIKSKGTAKVAFVLYSAAMWSCGEIYRMMESDSRFDPYIVVAKYTNDSNARTWPTYMMTQNFFKKENYKHITVPDDIKKNTGWEAMGEPDIVFYLTPYHTLLPESINQGYLPSSVITIYIPYSYMLIKAEQKYDVPAFKYSWRHFCDSEIYRQILIDYNHLYKRNTYFVGYPKMDIFCANRNINETKLWKLDGKNKKKIIFAPHHSLKDLDYCSSHFSTFDKNYQFVLDLARKYSDSTTWIYKPHPNLKKTVVMAGVFKSTGYDEYINQWDNLPNAKVVQEGTYADYFVTSDAMICDSVSFLAEYQFTGKPLLFLTRPEQEFNKFGSLVQSVLYKCPGENLKEIEEFLSNVVISENDYMKAERDDFFKKNLDYFHRNGGLTASEQIFNEILKFCFEKSEQI